MNYLNYRSCLLSVLLITFFSAAHAQYSSINGKFTISAREACVGATVSITADCANCSDYDFDLDGSGDSRDHTYTAPGTYKVRALAAGGSIPDSVFVTIYPDTIPQFEVYRCAGRTVELKLNDDNYDSYRITWGDGNQNIISGTDTEELHTYATEGNKTITVQGLYDLADGNGNCTPNQKIVEVTNNLPVAQITSIYPPDNQNDRVVIKFNKTPNALYRLQLAINNASTWIPANPITADMDSVVITNLQLDQNYYCFRIATLDACQSGNPPAAFSPVVCTADLDVVFTNNEENRLSWNTNGVNISNFTIRINEEGNVTTQPRPAADRTFNHAAVNCNRNYCYTLISNYPGGATVTSLEKCGTAKYVATLPAINDIVTQVDGEQIFIDWQDVPPTLELDTYTISRSVNNGTFSVLATDLINSEYSDDNLNPVANTYCYNVGYSDRCDNLSAPGRNVCAIRLTGSASLGEATLKWNSYSGYSNGIVHYRIDRLNSAGGVLSSFTTSDLSFVDELSATDPQELYYRVTAIPMDGSRQPSISNLYKVIRKGFYNAPTAFTPGIPGENSKFTIVSPFITAIDLRIYNRWGQLIYQTTDLENGWNGTNQSGEPMPQGTYIYSAEFTYENGDQSEAKGSVYLLRK